MPEYGIINTDLLNLRAGASTTSQIITQLKRGTVLEIIATVNADWANVRVDGTAQTGFVSKAYLTITPTRPGDPQPITPTPVAPVAPTTPGTGIAAGQQAQVITASGINVRSGAGVQFPAITALPNGAVVDVLGREGDWLKLRVATGGEGYALAQFMQLITATTQPTHGYLVENPDLLTLDLLPDKLIPPQTNTAGDTVARIWNSFGGLIGKLSSLLNIPMGSVVAVLAAESGGTTFSADGRMVIRFEVHIFYQYWGANNEDVFNRFFQFDRSAPRNAWKNHLWRPNTASSFQPFHGNQDLEWQVLTFARSLSDTNALMSISMGAPQIMGFNFKRLGYESVQKMYDYFARSAHAQLLAMFDFVKSPSGVSPAIQALQNHDFLTFASIYNGSANAPAYSQIIQNFATLFDRLIAQAQPRLTQPTIPRGPSDTPAPADPISSTTPALTPVQPTPDPSPNPPITVIGPTPAPTTTNPVVASTTDGLNVRSQPNTQASILATLAKNQQVSALESADQVRAKTARPSSDNQWINIRLDDGRVGYVAAWLVSVSTGIAKSDIDSFIDNIPDRFEIPAEYDTLWAARDRIGLPDPFNELPIQITTQARLVNLTINGFGPNSFALQYWQRYYSNTGGMHNGYDYIVETGTPVRAVADGVIVRSWPFMGDPADKTVILWCYLPSRIKDSNGNREMSNVLVCYAHLSNNDLKKEGDVVKAGDIIGISGTPAGETDNDHLHMELHMLASDTPLRKSTRRLLRLYNGDQPNDNFTPFNPLLFYSKRLIKYHLQQGFSRQYAGLPAYPTAQTLGQNGAGHLGLLDQLTLAYYQYGVPVVWKNSGKPWPTGVITLRMLPDRLPSFPIWTPYSLAQKG